MSRRTAGTTSSLSLFVTLCLAALVATMAAQGGYFSRGAYVSAALLITAAIAGVSGRAFRLHGLRPTLIGTGLLLVWVLGIGAVEGDGGASVRTAGLLSAVVVVMVGLRELRKGEREVFLEALLAVGCLLALTGWAGVAFHLDPWALVDQGLWRAASTLTYANATAGALVPLCLVALAVSVDGHHPRRSQVAAFILLMGIGATGSRGGGIALALGGLILCRRLGARRVVRVMLAPAVGAAVSLVGLLPSVPESSAPHPLIAVSALIAGAVVVVAWPARGATPARHRSVPVWVGLPIAVALVVGLGLTLGHRVLPQIGDARFTLASSDRQHQTAAAWHEATTHPLTGTGPGHLRLSWTQDGATYTAEYVHNEYLQWLAEYGVIGLGLLVAALILACRATAVATSLLPAGEAAGLRAALVAFLAHSSLDFLWHVPAVVLTAAVLFGLAVPISRRNACPEPAISSVPPARSWVASS